MNARIATSMTALSFSNARIGRRFCWLVSLGLIAGCAAPQGIRQEVATAVERWSEPQIETKTASANEPVDPLEFGLVDDAPEPPDLQQLIHDALARHPSVKAAIADIMVKLEAIPQATSLQDPMLRMIIRPEPIQTAAGDIVFTLGASQKIPLPAKLELRGKAAAAEVRTAIERLNNVRIAVIGDVKRAYYGIYVADRSLEITNEHIDLLEEMEAIMEVDFQVGGAGLEDLLRLQTELSDLENRVTQLLGRRTSAVAAMNQLQDRPTTTPVTTIPPQQPAMIDARVEDLIALAERHNPEIAAFTWEIDRRRKEVELAALIGVPDLTLGFEWSHGKDRRPFIPPANLMTGRHPPFNDASAGGDDNWALTIGFNLPIWAERNRAALRQARERVNGAIHRKHEAKNLIAFRLHDAWARARTHQETIKILASTIVPQARVAYEISLTSYQGESTNYFDVIENWRKLLNFELMVHRETASLEIAVADLQKEVGASLLFPDDSTETTK
jgi:cobalt-zinc-cadmium efflux system outer membrane protein